MATKLTGHQIECLKALKAGPRSAYPGLHMGSLNALALNQLVKANHRLGSMFSPHVNIMWSLTDAGRDALSALES